MACIEDIAIPEKVEWIPDIFIRVNNNHPEKKRTKGFIWEYPFPKFNDLLVVFCRYPVFISYYCQEDVWAYAYTNFVSNECGFFYSKHLEYQVIDILKYI